MTMLRCTQKLLHRLPKGVATSSSADVSAAALGDWYATILFTRPSHLVLCLSEPSRLCVVLPARDLKALLPRWREATGQLLRALNAPARAVEQELERMQPVKVSPTSGGANYRSALGTLNEFAWMVQDVCPQEKSPLAHSLFLSGILCSPLEWRYPREVALARLEAVYGQADS